MTGPRLMGPRPLRSYDDLLYLLDMNEEQIAQCAADVGLKLGHAAKFRDYLLREQRQMRGQPAT